MPFYRASCNKDAFDRAWIVKMSGKLSDDGYCVVRDILFSTWDKRGSVHLDIGAYGFARRAEASSLKIWICSVSRGKFFEKWDIVFFSAVFKD